MLSKSWKKCNKKRSNASLPAKQIRQVHGLSFQGAGWQRDPMKGKGGAAAAAHTPQRHANPNGAWCEYRKQKGSVATRDACVL